MATVAHCVFCFENLSASLDRQQSLTLQQVEDSWVQYRASQLDEIDTGNGLDGLALEEMSDSRSATETASDSS